MRWRSIPIAVLAIAALYLLVGGIGAVAHFSALHSNLREGLEIELTELTAVVCGIFLLRAQNWARWLAVAWIGFHVGLSVYDGYRGFVVHLVFLCAITWLLFRPASADYFRRSAVAE